MGWFSLQAQWCFDFWQRLETFLSITVGGSGGGVAAGIKWEGARELLNVLKWTGQILQQGVIQSQMSLCRDGETLTWPTINKALALGFQIGLFKSIARQQSNSKPTLVENPSFIKRGQFFSEPSKINVFYQEPTWRTGAQSAPKSGVERPRQEGALHHMGSWKSFSEDGVSGKSGWMYGNRWDMAGRLRG